MDGDRKLDIKHHSLTGRITLSRMYEAFRRVKRNRGAAGVDKVSIGMFEANLADNLRALMHSLKRGTFQPLPTRRKYIDKGGEPTHELLGVEVEGFSRELGARK